MGDSSAGGPGTSNRGCGVLTLPGGAFADLMGWERHPESGRRRKRRFSHRRPRRLFPMQDRIAYQGITFDDVLLEPGYSELLPRQVDARTQLTAKIPLEHPDPVGPDGHGHRGRAGHRAGAGGGPGRHPQEHVDRGPDPRGRQGQAVRERDHRRPDHAAARRHRRRRPARSCAGTTSRACRSPSRASSAAS